MDGAVAGALQNRFYHPASGPYMIHRMPVCQAFARFQFNTQNNL
jgi:hypothetical protein